MASNVAVVDSAKASVAGFPAPAQEADQKSGAAESARGEKVVKTERDCTFGGVLSILLQL